MNSIFKLKIQYFCKNFETLSGYKKDNKLCFCVFTKAMSHMSLYILWWPQESHKLTSNISKPQDMNKIFGYFYY